MEDHILDTDHILDMAEIKSYFAIIVDQGRHYKLLEYKLLEFKLPKDILLTGQTTDMTNSWNFLTTNF